MAYIYQIVNDINQKIYIGKTEYANPEKRWKQHIAESKRERSAHRALYRAINKYGIEHFHFSVIEETNSPNAREQYYIQYFDTFHNGYNETLGGDGAAYLILPEQEICKFYCSNHTLTETVAQFGYDIETIRKVLYKNNIKILSGAEQTAIWRGRAVAQIDKVTDEIINIFPSVTVAEKAMGNNRHITHVCNGKRKTAYGYKWRYVDTIQNN